MNLAPGCFSPLAQGELHGFLPLEEILIVVVGDDAKLSVPASKAQWPARFTCTCPSLAEAAARYQLAEKQQAYVLCGQAAVIVQCLEDLSSAQQVSGLHAPLYALADAEVHFPSSSSSSSPNAPVVATQKASLEEVRAHRVAAAARDAT